MGWFVVHLIMCVVTSATMCLNGFYPNTWQWWIICLAQAVSYVCGRGREEDRR